MTNQESRTIIESKVVLIGSTDSDKSSIMHRVARDDFNPDFQGTYCTVSNTMQIELDDATVNLNIWEAAGQEKYKFMAPVYYRGSNVAIIAFSLTKVNSLDEARKWIFDLKKELNEMPILFLVGSKCDSSNERVIVYEDALQLAKEFNAFYHEVSAQSGLGIKLLFENVAIESAKKLSNEILVLSSIKCNLKDKVLSSMKIKNPNIFLTFSIKNNPHVVKCTYLIENSLKLSWNDPISFCIYDKKPDVLMINIFHESENGESILICKIDFSISDSKKSNLFQKNIYSSKDTFSKKEIAKISFKLDHTNYDEQMKANKISNSLEYKQSKEDHIFEQKEKDYEAEMEKKTKEIKILQEKMIKYESEMERKTKEYEADLTKKMNEIKDLQEKVHKYESEMESKTKEYEDDLTKKTNEIKVLKEKMNELIENHDKEMQNVINKFQNSQTVSTPNDKSMKGNNKDIIPRKDDNSPEKFCEISEKVDEPLEKNNEDNYFFGIDDESHFETIKKISEGMVSVTYKIIDNRTKFPLCKKILKVEGTTFKDLQNVIKEFQLLHYLRHPCICNAIAINTSEIYAEETETSDEVTTVALLLEFVDFNLKDCLADNILNNTLKTRIVVEISHAMRYLHAKGLIYRDLKIDNIMLNSVFQVKMIDFGLAKINECLFGEEMMNSISLTKGIGNAHFMSPEMMNEENYDNKTDVFSFGIVLYVIFVGELPKQSMKEKMMRKAIRLPEESSSISKCCIDLMKMCIAIDPKERPSFEEILEFIRKHKFMLSSDVDPSIIEQRDKELESFNLKKL